MSPDGAGRRLRVVATAAGVLVLVLALGLAAGLAAVVLHPYWWGLALATLASLATVVALPPRMLVRAPFGLGFGAVVARASMPRGEGDYLVAQSVAGYLLLALALALVMGSIISCAPRRRRPAAPAPSSGSIPAEG